jgi:hypothetical protein
MQGCLITTVQNANKKLLETKGTKLTLLHAKKHRKQESGNL